MPSVALRQEQSDECFIRDTPPLSLVAIGTERIHIVGGEIMAHQGEQSRTPAFREIARDIGQICTEQWSNVSVVMHMAAHKHCDGAFSTPAELQGVAKNIATDPDARTVFWLPTMSGGGRHNRSHVNHLRVVAGSPLERHIRQTRDAVAEIRGQNPNVCMVGLLPSTGATEEDQYRKSQRLLRESGIDLALAYDAKAHTYIVSSPEGASLCQTTEQSIALQCLVEAVYLRQCNIVDTDFTPKTEIPATLRMQRLTSLCLHALTGNSRFSGQRLARTLS